MRKLWEDLRLAFHGLRRRPGFAAAVVATLALGIGGNVALFSIVDGVLLRPLPYPDPDRLVIVWENDRLRGTDREGASAPDYLDLAERIVDLVQSGETLRANGLAALGYTRADIPALVEATLKYALEGPLRAQEIFQVTAGMGETARGRDRRFRWLTENYAALMQRVPPQTAGFLPFFASGCETQRLEAARAFFGDPAHQVPGTPVTLAKVTDQVTDCTNLREREGGAVTTYLNQLVGAR